MDATSSHEKDCGVIGNLFQSMVNEMKVCISLINKRHFFFFETLCTLFTIYRIITLNTLFTIRGCRVAAYPDNRASLMPRPTRRSILPVRKQWSWAERLWASTPLNVKLGTGTAGIDSPGDPVRTPPRAAKPASPSPPRAPCLPALCPAWHQRAWSPA